MSPSPNYRSHSRRPYIRRSGPARPMLHGSHRPRVTSRPAAGFLAWVRNGDSQPVGYAPGRRPLRDYVRASRSIHPAVMWASSASAVAWRCAGGWPADGIPAAYVRDLRQQMIIRTGCPHPEYYYSSLATFIIQCDTEGANGGH